MNSTMESVVPAEITTELTQILSNLVLGDNEIRSKYVPPSQPTSFAWIAEGWCCPFSAENAVNERLAHTPELYLLALSHFAIAADTEVVSSYRRFSNKWSCDGAIEVHGNRRGEAEGAP
jgi:hypothetical protein